MAFPIIGADFLSNFKMVVDLSGRQLLCPAGLKMPLEAPHAGSLAAVAIGVVEVFTQCRHLPLLLHFPQWRHLERGALWQ